MNRRRAAAGLAASLICGSGCALGPSALPETTRSAAPPASPPPAAPAPVAQAAMSPQPTRPPIAAPAPAPAPVAASIPALTPTPAPEAPTTPTSLNAPELPPVETAQAVAPPTIHDPAVSRVSLPASTDTARPLPARAPSPAGETPGSQPMAAAIPGGSENPGKPATMIAARVGDSVITLRELKRIVRERIQGRAEFSQLTDDQKNQLAREALEFLIDRAMLVQAARKDLKNPKQWDMFKEYVDKAWLDRELPSLIKRAKVADEYELDRQLKERGESLAEKREAFLLDTMSREYAMMKLQPKMEPPRLPEIYAYYRENLSSFDRPAQVSWREIFVPIDAEHNRDQAKQTADTALARLQRGEAFASVAKELSRSARAADGGLWQTGYDSYASTAVNEQLKQLPINQNSELIEDGRGFYIVRVEARRAAGPAPFEEVERQITEALMARNYEQRLTTFLKELRRQTPISSPLFEGTPSEPTQVRAGEATASRSSR